MTRTTKEHSAKSAQAGIVGAGLRGAAKAAAEKMPSLARVARSPAPAPAAGLPQPTTEPAGDAGREQRAAEAWDRDRDFWASSPAQALPDSREASIRAAERERAAARMMGAYNEWHRLKNEQGERFAAWKRGGERGPLPEFRLGSLPDYLAAAIRGGRE